MNHQEELAYELEALANEFIRGAVHYCDGVNEGKVMSLGPPPYRRIDCDGRALAYIRCRPRKRAVRVDVSGLWPARISRLRVRTASGSASLLLRTDHDVREAVDYIQSAILRMREAEQRDRDRRVVRLRAPISAPPQIPWPEPLVAEPEVATMERTRASIDRDMAALVQVAALAPRPRRVTEKIVPEDPTYP